MTIDKILAQIDAEIERLKQVPALLATDGAKNALLIFANEKAAHAKIAAAHRKHVGRSKGLRSKCADGAAEQQQARPSPMKESRHSTIGLRGRGIGYSQV